MFEETLDEELGKYEKFKKMIDDAAELQNEVLQHIEVRYPYWLCH